MMALSEFDAVLGCHLRQSPYSARLWALSLPLIYICCWKLMKSEGTDGSLSLPFVRKVMVGYFVNDTYKVTAALLFVVSLLVRWN
jgi:hypothetical protein